ncbi:conserved hypothetical protein, partial [Trichinella spiralis]
MPGYSMNRRNALSNNSTKNTITKKLTLTKRTY